MKSIWATVPASCFLLCLVFPAEPLAAQNLGLQPPTAVSELPPEPPEIPEADYVARRDSLLARLPGDAVVVAFGERTPLAFPDFHQVPAFRYLTGIEEPNALLVLVRRGADDDALLFREQRTERQVLVDGPLEDPLALERRTGLRPRPLADFDAAIDSLLRQPATVYVLRDVRAYDPNAVDSLTRAASFAARLRVRHPAVSLGDADSVLYALRARKSEAELALLRHAAAITSASIRDAMPQIRPGLREYQVQALIEYGFRIRGGDRPSFASNVSAGENATTVHHRASDDVLEDGSLVLMDVGAFYRGYAADITRTFPVNGVFSGEQREIYQLVLDAQRAAERQVRVGGPAQAMDDSSRAVIAQGLTRLGFIEGPEAEFDPPWREQCAIRPVLCKQNFLFYSHGLAHGIGLEVHDVVQYRQPPYVFRVNDAFTIEPGVYLNTRRLDLLPDTPRNRAFAASVRAAVERYHGIGVRIEDDYLLTEKGLERISTAPREIGEIEAVMAGASAARRPTGNAVGGE